MAKAMLFLFLHNGALPVAHRRQVTQTPTFEMVKSTYYIFRQAGDCFLTAVYRFGRKKSASRTLCWCSHEAGAG